MHIHIMSSPRTGSYSVFLGSGIVKKRQTTYPNSHVQLRDLARNSFPHLEEVHSQSFNTPAERRTANQQVVLIHSKPDLPAKVLPKAMAGVSL